MTEIKPHQLVVREIPVAKIQPNPGQAREHFNEERMQELAASIKEKGVLQPITVRDISQGGAQAFQLISGERRWRACELISRETIPGFVMEVSDDEAVELSFIENLQREDLTPIEEARGLAILTDVHKGNKSKVAEVIGKSSGYVDGRLSLLQLPEEVQNMLDAGSINLAQANVLLEVEDSKQQIKWAKMVIRLNLNANQLKGRTQNLTGERKKSSKGERKATYKSIQRTVIALYEDAESFVLNGSVTPEQRNTLAKQIALLSSVLDALREKLGHGEDLSSDDEEIMETEEV